MASNALVTSGLTRRFGRRVAVEDLSLQVREGDIYGFLGPNGAGKTTAIRCMVGLLRADAGTVSVFGETDPVRQRAHVGALVETPAFHGWMSARANLELSAAYAGYSKAGPLIDEALARVGLGGRDREAVRGYSLGMRQRLGIARALVGQPRLLLLDEPTNGLDPRGMKEIRDLLKDLARGGLTVFVSSHLLGEVEQLCTRVGILEKGRLVYEGDATGLGPVGQTSGGDLVDVGVRDPAALAAALAKIPGATLAGDGEGGRARIRLDSLDSAALNKALVSAGVEVEALIPVERSLEDVFLALTSKEIT